MGCIELSKPWVWVHQGPMAHFIVQLATGKTIRVQNLDKEDVWLTSAFTTQTFDFIKANYSISSAFYLTLSRSSSIPPLFHPCPFSSSLLPPFHHPYTLLCAPTCPFSCLYTFSLSLLISLSVSVSHSHTPLLDLSLVFACSSPTFVLSFFLPLLILSGWQWFLYPSFLLNI